jgi:serine protease AprX
MAEDQKRLPIKVVLTSEKDYRRPKGGGGPQKSFGDVDRRVRSSLIDQLSAVQTHFAPVFEKAPGIPAVARVVLKEKALAKSHRPVDLLERQTCPIIGVQGFGELLVSVRREGLEHLMGRIDADESTSIAASISTIDHIEPYTAADAYGNTGIAGLKKLVSDGKDSLKIRLFRHDSARLDDALLDAFKEQLRAFGIPEPESLYYAEGMRIFRVKEATPDSVGTLAAFVGTQSISGFPIYRVLHAASTAIGRAQTENFPIPDSNQSYGVLGIIDTGTNPNDPILAPWTVARHPYVPSGYENYDHGSFVAGLAVHARRLNHNDSRFPGTAVKFVDVSALPRGGTISETELLDIIREVLPKHPEVRVWNLSLAKDDDICKDRGFSDLAIALDQIQDQFNVTFVFAAGNYRTRPLRGWPPEDLGEADRICSPADSVRGLAVGSVAHLMQPTSRVKVEHPSPFTRRGPGPTFIPKPELVHYGGNCDAAANYQQTGILSFNGNGFIAEDVGTSFSAPLVASTMASVFDAIATPITANLAKALMIHAAVLNSTSTLSALDLRYRGFGIPADISSLLTCEPWAATMIFEPDLISGIEFEKLQFPIPACLRENGSVRGEFVMTLAYDPPLDPNFGAEYCRTNVEVSLGTYEKNSKGKWEHRGMIPPEPKDISKLYEKHLVEHGFKWSPVKVYRRQIPRGISGEDWRLKVSVHYRSGFVNQMLQGIALIVTMRDPQKKAPVYDQVVTTMNRIGWKTIDLQIQERIRIGQSV